MSQIKEDQSPPKNQKAPILNGDQINDSEG